MTVYRSYLMFVGLFCLLLTSCMNSSIEYEYADGSGNRYVLTADSLEYIPVKPHESSTGIYSGGEPKKVSINPKTYNLIKQTLDAALSNKTIHTDQRAKKTGLITVKSKKQQAIISSGPEVDFIDSLLKKTLD